MTNDSISSAQFQFDGEAKMGTDVSAAAGERLFDAWFDPIEHAVRDRVRSFIEELIEGELSAVLARPRYGRRAQDGGANSGGSVGYRHGSRKRMLTGTFGRTEIAVPRARLQTPDGKTAEWKSAALRAYQRRTHAAEALIASAYLAGVNTRRVRRALAALFGGAVGKDIVSRTWRKVKGDWDAWNARSLADEPIVRLILDGTVVRVRLDRQATAISLLVVIGVRADGQKVLLAVKSMGAKAPRPGAPCSTISSSAACGGLTSSSSTAARASPARSRPFGTTCPCRGVRSISTETCRRARPNASTTRSPRITLT